MHLPSSLFHFWPRLCTYLLLLSVGNAILFGPATAAALKFVVTLLFFFVLRNAGKAWRDGGALEKRGKTQ